MRSAAVSTLAALAVVVSGCGGSGLASEPASRLSEPASILAYVWEGKPTLVKVDAVTLEPTGRALAVEHFHLCGRVAATVRSALDTESPPAHHRTCTTGVVL
jgi:hypothetical protein